MFDAFGFKTWDFQSSSIFRGFPLHFHQLFPLSRFPIKLLTKCSTVHQTSLNLEVRSILRGQNHRGFGINCNCSLAYLKRGFNWKLREGSNYSASPWAHESNWYYLSECVSLWRGVEYFIRALGQLFWLLRLIESQKDWTQGTIVFPDENDPNNEKTKWDFGRGGKEGRGRTLEGRVNLEREMGQFRRTIRWWRNLCPFGTVDRRNSKVALVFPAVLPVLRMFSSSWTFSVADRISVIRGKGMHREEGKATGN